MKKVIQTSRGVLSSGFNRLVQASQDMLEARTLSKELQECITQYGNLRQAKHVIAAIAHHANNKKLSQDAVTKIFLGPAPWMGGTTPMMDFLTSKDTEFTRFEPEQKERLIREMTKHGMDLRDTVVTFFNPHIAPGLYGGIYFSADMERIAQRPLIEMMKEAEDRPDQVFKPYTTHRSALKQYGFLKEPAPVSSVEEPPYAHPI